MTDVTRILNAIEEGDEKTAGELLQLVYEAYLLLVEAKEQNRNSRCQTKFL